MTDQEQNQIDFNNENHPVRCPNCKSEDTDKLHHQATFALPECSYWHCNECEFDWDHS